MSGRSQSTTKVFVGSLPDGTTADELRELFRPYGTIAECDVVNRCGFIHLENRQLAFKAIEQLNNFHFKGSRITVEKGRVKRNNGPMRHNRDRDHFRDRGGQPYDERRGRGRSYIDEREHYYRNDIQIQPLFVERRPLLDDRRPLIDDRRPLLDNRRPLLDNRRALLDDRHTLGERNMMDYYRPLPQVQVPQISSYVSYNRRPPLAPIDRKPLDSDYHHLHLQQPQYNQQQRGFIPGSRRDPPPRKY